MLIISSSQAETNEHNKEKKKRSEKRFFPLNFFIHLFSIQYSSYRSTYKHNQQQQQNFNLVKELNQAVNKYWTCYTFLFCFYFCPSYAFHSSHEPTSSFIHSVFSLTNSSVHTTDCALHGKFIKCFWYFHCIHKKLVSWIMINI